jgi:hypothetical protein
VTQNSVRVFPGPVLTAQQRADGMTQEMLNLAHEAVITELEDNPLLLRLLRYISYIPRREKIGNSWQVTGVQPYMQVAGRIKILGSANATGEAVGIQTFCNTSPAPERIPWYNLDGQRVGLLLVPAMACLAVLYNRENQAILRTGTAKLGGERGAAKNCPIEDAETSAVGRCLGLAGIGEIGSGLASAEEIMRVQEESGPSGRKKSKSANTKTEKDAGSNGSGILETIEDVQQWLKREEAKLLKVSDTEPAEGRLFDNLMGVLEKAGIGNTYLPELIAALWPEGGFFEGGQQVSSRKAMVLMNLVARRSFVEKERTIILAAVEEARQSQKK